MTRRRISAADKRMLWDRQCGTCNCGCGGELVPGQVDVEHQIPLALGGPDTLENMSLWLRSCHRLKTKADVRRIAKAKRQQKHHETGRSRARKGPAMRSRGFTGWRRFDGSPVKAETRSGANAAGE